MGKSAIRKFVERIRKSGRSRAECVVLSSASSMREFVCYDWGDDSFVIEEGVLDHEDGHLPILIVKKQALGSGREGYVMTLATGNHTVAAIPLLKGEFWDLSEVAAGRRSQVMSESVVCCNAVTGRIEISQRDVPTATIMESDAWLQRQGVRLDEVIMSERNDDALDRYRRLGQEWRIKMLAWTQQEMELAIVASRTRIGSKLRYYRSAKGVHFLSYAEFNKLGEMAARNFDGFVTALREMVAIFEGDVRSCMRSAKFGGHHEIELFGVRRGMAVERVLPELERLMEGITLKQLSQQEVVAYIRLVDGVFKGLLERVQLADESSQDFKETLYLHLSGVIYGGQVDRLAPAFDDRRTALPGATFQDGMPVFHPGVDFRSRVMLANVAQVLSKDEVIEYANIYEIRAESGVELGSGAMREITYKTNLAPLTHSVFEKRLKLKHVGYGNYVLARVKGFKALGVALGNYRLLQHPANEQGRQINYYMRNRCPGASLESISPSQYYMRQEGKVDATREDPDIVSRMAALMGDAAAQNMALKKYVVESDGSVNCRYGMGKEIYEFGRDSMTGKVMPLHVRHCSIRGTCGWPDLSESEENLVRMGEFYMGHYARGLYEFWEDHRECVTLEQLVEHFMTGFSGKTREMYWHYSVRREQFDGFNPDVRRQFHFRQHWQFALWALEQQAQQLVWLAGLLREKVGELAGGGRALKRRGGGSRKSGCGKEKRV